MFETLFLYDRIVTGSPADRFDDLAGHFVGVPGVAPPGEGAGFGSSALRIDGRIFAMLVRDSLVVKLPAARATHFVSTGQGTHFDANKGKPMKQWLVLDSASDYSWVDLATEALAFVRGATPPA
jgi:hypothetical protein